MGEQFLTSRGQPILSLAEFDDYVYGLPEEAVPPALFNTWLTNRDVELTELRDCLQGPALEAAGESREARKIVHLALERLRSLFPAEVT
jgi:hypothetical protein